MAGLLAKYQQEMEFITRENDHIWRKEKKSNHLVMLIFDTSAKKPYLVSWNPFVGYLIEIPMLVDDTLLLCHELANIAKVVIHLRQTP